MTPPWWREANCRMCLGTPWLGNTNQIGRSKSFNRSERHLAGTGNPVEEQLPSCAKADSSRPATGEKNLRGKVKSPPTSQVQPIVGPFQPSLSRLLRRPGAFWGSGVGKRANGESVWTRPNRTPSKLKIPLCACKTENLWSGKASQ